MRYMTLALPPGLKLRLLRLARRAGMSLSQYILQVLKRGTQREPHTVHAQQLWRLKRAAQARGRGVTHESVGTAHTRREIQGSVVQIPESTWPRTMKIKQTGKEPLEEMRADARGERPAPPVVLLPKLLAQATQTLGSQEAAEKWLNSPQIGLDGKRPVDLLTRFPALSG